MGEEKIYTFLGDVLLSVNPYRPIPALYEPMPKSEDLNSRSPDAKPHLYVLADRAYHAIFDVDVRFAVIEPNFFGLILRGFIGSACLPIHHDQWREWSREDRSC